MGVVLIANFGCETTKSAKQQPSSRRTRQWEVRRGGEIDDSTPQWWYARREYDPNYMHWGKMRPLDSSVNTEKWVLLDESQCKAPHRQLSRAGADNGREYRFFGYFRRNPGYEPASDEVVPVFILQKWEPVYKNQAVQAEPVGAEQDERDAAPPVERKVTPGSPSVSKVKSRSPPAAPPEPAEPQSPPEPVNVAPATDPSMPQE